MNKTMMVLIVCLIASPVTFCAYNAYNQYKEANRLEQAGLWLDKNYPNHTAYYCNKDTCAALVGGEVIKF